MSGLRYVAFGVAYLVVHTTGGWLLGGHPLARALLGNAGLLSAPLLVCAVILYRRRTWTGCHRLFWDTFGIGVALWAIGHMGWAYDEIVLGRMSWLQWHTVFTLCGGIGPLIALLARPHRGARAEHAGTVALVIAGYGLLSVFVYSYFVLVPSVVIGVGEAAVALLSLVQVNRGLLFLGAAIGLYFARHTRWRATYGYLTLATGTGFALRFATNAAILRGTYHTGTLYDLAWIAPFLLYARAAWVAPATAADGHPGGPPAPLLHASLGALPVLLIPIIGYGTLTVYPLGDAADAFRSLLTGLMTVAGLGLLTLRLAAQGSELQRADARVRLLAAATEQTADLILITRADGRFEHANDAFVRALGYTRQELATLSSPDLMERGFDPPGQQIFEHVRDRGIWRGTLMRRCRDGSTFPASCTVVGLKDDAGRITHCVGVERDITEELKLRDQLVHSERLSAIGELVAGVAHEINNPLQTIVGSVELMMEERGRPERQDLEVVRREAARAGQIVRNLLSFVRRSAPDRLGADLNDIVRATVRLRDFHLQQRNVTLDLDLHPSPLPVRVNREEIQQIVLNLLLNAEHAILGAARGGTISVRTHAGSREQVIEIVDDGPGVSPELRGRIFEPFFTTKDVGEGTGLGLSISHGIASAHGGALELCETTKGACFRLTLPVGHGFSPADDAGAGSSHAQRGQADGRADALPHVPMALVIDDEASIRAFLVRLLERRGFEAVAVDSGEAALARDDRDRFSLVLCDVRMRGLNGFEIYSRFAAESPALASRFVFITGDGLSIASEYPDLRDVPVLAKPFSARDLDHVLASLTPSSSL